MDRAELERRFHEEDLQRLRGFRPIDDTFMRCLFRDDLPLAEYVLRIILGRDDLRLTHMETQRDLKRLLGARSLCLDVHGVDSENRQYDIEVQRADSGARPARARYHASAMDIEALDAGQEFEALPETYVIFITERDFFGSGLGLYPIERMNIALGTPFDDGAHILYVNGQYRGGDPLGQLMHDFLCNDPNDMLCAPMAERSRYYKENPKGVGEMCKAMEDMRREAWEMGREEGRTEGRLISLVDNVRNLRTSLRFSDQQIREILKITNEDWEKIAARI